MDRLQPFYGDVGVKLRSRERSVTEQFLNAPQIGASLKEMSRSRVP